MGCFLLLVIFVFISWSDLLIRDGYYREMILWYQGNRNEPFFLTMNCELLGAEWTFWELSWGEMFPTHKKNKWWVLFWIKEKDLLRVVRKETTQMSVESESVETTFIIIHHRPMSFMEDKVTCLLWPATPRMLLRIGDRSLPPPSSMTNNHPHLHSKMLSNPMKSNMFCTPDSKFGLICIILKSKHIIWILVFFYLYS